MAQVFSRKFALSIRLGILAALLVTTALAIVYRVNARADAPRDVAIEQPIPFSHKHHARDDGIDCRYCHTSVETSAFAGIPPLSTCMTCGCCLEACPQYDEDHYIGPQAIAQVRLFNMHPSGSMDREERLQGIMGEDGITNCGNAQNCVKVCPMNIQLTKAIYEENRETVLYGLLGWLKK